MTQATEHGMASWEAESAVDNLSRAFGQISDVTTLLEFLTDSHERELRQPDTTEGIMDTICLQRCRLEAYDSFARLAIHTITGNTFDLLCKVRQSLKGNQANTQNRIEEKQTRQ